MQIFYTPDISGDFYVFSEEESKHAVRVLRLQQGDAVSLIDGRGGLYHAHITDPLPKGCVVKIDRFEPEFGKKLYALHIAMAPTKSIDRFEWFLEKSTEIGIDRITPLLSDRSERKSTKKDRSEKVVLSAVKQSLKAYVPEVEDLTRFADFVRKDFGGWDRYIAHCDDSFERVAFSDIIVSERMSLVLIGPEGDFSPQEIAMAYDVGFKGISLGSSRLRTETAGVMAAAIAAISSISVISKVSANKR